MPTRARSTLAIAERSWAIFTAYYYEERSLEEIAGTWRMSPEQVGRIVAEVDAQIGRVRGPGNRILAPESPVEDLSLSVRTRNSLRSLGCHTIDDILQLNLSESLRGLGQKTRQELLAKLLHAGFHHSAHEEPPITDIRGLERSLDRLESRLGTALGTVAKEIRLLRQRLRKKHAAP
jgi:hypothetical protein